MEDLESELYGIVHHRLHPQISRIWQTYPFIPLWWPERTWLPTMCHKKTPHKYAEVGTHRVLWEIHVKIFSGSWMSDYNTEEITLTSGMIHGCSTRMFNTKQCYSISNWNVWQSVFHLTAFRSKCLRNLWHPPFPHFLPCNVHFYRMCSKVEGIFES